jgi:NDP-sugar pyrophosphorylase family protein
LGDTTLLDKIIQQFSSTGYTNFFVTLNNKKDLIKSYIKENLKKFKINIIEEKKHLGTIGSLRLIDKNLSNYFFVTNCDILIDANFQNIVEQHILSKCDLTIVSSFKSFEIPYGVFKISKKADLSDFKEKPSFNHLVNCGVYLMNKKLIKYIPKNKACDIDELLKILIKNKKKIKIYPIPGYAWQDFGAWKEYFKNA